MGGERGESSVASASLRGLPPPPGFSACSQEANGTKEKKKEQLEFSGHAGQPLAVRASKVSGWVVFQPLATSFPLKSSKSVKRLYLVYRNARPVDFDVQIKIVKASSQNHKRKASTTPRKRAKKRVFDAFFAVSARFSTPCAPFRAQIGGSRDAAQRHACNVVRIAKRQEAEGQQRSRKHRLGSILTGFPAFLTLVARFDALIPQG